MPSERSGRRRPISRRATPTPSATSAGRVVLVPVVVAVILSLPCISLGYFWDDYLFLTQRGGEEVGKFLLPNPHAAFYRPVAQGLYFRFLSFIDPSNGIGGHLINLGVLALAVALLTSLVSRLSGPRSGLFAGLVFACLGAVPSLVAWISCSQDLFAIALVLAAFLLRHEKQNIAALICAVAAVLCKEPAMAAFPILAFWDHIVGRPATRAWLRAWPYTLVLFLWVLVHPGIKILLERGFQSGATGYVGVDRPDHWGGYFWRYVTTLVNLPPVGFSNAVMGDRIQFGLVALLVMVLGIRYLEKRQGLGQSTGQVPVQRVALIAALLGIPTLLMPILLVRHWAPYFVCIPAVGFAILLGPVLARQRGIVALALLSGFLLLGIRYRSAYPVREPAWTEAVFVQAADALKQVRANFRTLFPAFPRYSQVVISTSSTGLRGIHGTLVDNQALQVWYNERSLRAVSTLKRHPGASTEFLVRITKDLDVLAIDPDSHRVRSATQSPPDLSEIDRPLRNYARAAAASGESDRSIRILKSLARVGPPESRVSAERLIVAILLANGRNEEAKHVLAASQGVTRENALALVERLLAEPTESERLDEASFEAFGLSSTDPETIRRMMQDLLRDGLVAQAAWYAERLHRLVPEDADATEVLLAAARSGVRPDRTPG